MKDLQKILTTSGESLAELSSDRKLMLVFLRHFGCIFCKEALSQLSEMRDMLRRSDTELVFVHMAEPRVAEEHFTEFGLENVKHISDPSCGLYEEFGLTKGKISQLFGLNTLIRGFKASKEINKSMNLKQIGDSFQMPGIFMLQDGEVRISYIHKTASDKPDYEKLLNCCSA